MTREERENEIRKQLIPTKEECLVFFKELTKLVDVRFVPYYKVAIKALEQESVIDKIRTEITQMSTISANANDIYKADVLDIIDKYK